MWYLQLPMEFVKGTLFGTSSVVHFIWIKLVNFLKLLTVTPLCYPDIMASTFQIPLLHSSVYCETQVTCTINVIYHLSWSSTRHCESIIQVLCELLCSPCVDAVYKCELKAKVELSERWRRDLDNNETRGQEGTLIAEIQHNVNTDKPAR